MDRQVPLAMASPGLFRARGVLTVWLGNEAALTLANPAIEVDGRIATTRGEDWTSPHDVSLADVSEAAGFVAIDPVDVAEGSVAWLAGPSYVDGYRTLFYSPDDDLLAIDAWIPLGDGWLIHFDSAMRFYEVGANVASAAKRFYEEALASGTDPKSESIRIARSVYEGSPGVPRSDRRIADAVWYSLTGDFDLYSRAVNLAAKASGQTEAEVKNYVAEQVEFYRAKTSLVGSDRSTELGDLYEWIDDLHEEVRGLHEHVRDLSKAIQRVQEVGTERLAAFNRTLAMLADRLTHSRQTAESPRQLVEIFTPDAAPNIKDVPAMLKLKGGRFRPKHSTKINVYGKGVVRTKRDLTRTAVVEGLVPRRES